MMFQRGGAQASDLHLGSFYGLTMPLLKHGIPVEPVQIENATSPGFLDPYRVLLLTYEGQKPPTPEFHKALADWVQKGGALVMVDDDKDPFNVVHDWWNTAPNSYKLPRAHLFEQLGIASDTHGVTHIGKGIVAMQSASPATLSYRPEGADQVRTWTREAAKAIGLEWKDANGLVLRRGPYVIAAGLEESVKNMPPHALKGRFISLFEPGLPVHRQVELKPGLKTLLVDLDAFPHDYQGVVAAACRVQNQQVTAESIRFRATGIANSKAVVRVAMPATPKSVELAGKPVDAITWTFSDGVLKLNFVNDAKGQEWVIHR
jgi:hypothetical protein